jgi:hypothetical protein
MKRSKLVVIGLALSMGGLASPNALGQELINEDFTSGSGCLSNYNADVFLVNGTGELEVGTAGISGGGCRYIDYALCSTQVTGDFVLDVDVMVTGAWENRASVVYGWNGDLQFYEFQINNYEYPTFQETLLSLYVADAPGGNCGGIVVQAIADVPSGQWHHVRIEVQGDRHRVFVDDVLHLEGYDSTFSSGQVGLGGGFNGYGRFDNLVVTQGGGHPDPELTILRAPTLPASVSPGQLVTDDFDWNLYSGDTQPGSPVWINVYGWRDANGNWVGQEPVVFYNGIPGFYPGYTALGEQIACTVPTAPGTYTLWAHAFPTVSATIAIQEFENVVIAAETNVAKVLSTVDAVGGQCAGGFGSNNYLHTGTTGLLSDLPQGTVEFCVFMDQLAAPPAHLVNSCVGKRDAGNGLPPLTIGIDPAGKIVVNWYPIPSPPESRDLVSESAICPNDWVHVAITWDGAFWRVYICGIEDNAVPDSSGLRAATDRVWLGADPWRPEMTLKGRLDNVRISNIARQPGDFGTALDANTLAVWLLNGSGIDEGGTYDLTEVGLITYSQSCTCSVSSCPADSDSDGLSNCHDDCPSTPAPFGVDAQGRSLGDLDNDCDVDLNDFATLAGNFTG